MNKCTGCNRPIHPDPEELITSEVLQRKDPPGSPREEGIRSTPPKDNAFFPEPEKLATFCQQMLGQPQTDFNNQSFLRKFNPKSLPFCPSCMELIQSLYFYQMEIVRLRELVQALVLTMKDNFRRCLSEEERDDENHDGNNVVLRFRTLLIGVIPGNSCKRSLRNRRQNRVTTERRKGLNLKNDLMLKDLRINLSRISPEKGIFSEEGSEMEIKSEVEEEDGDGNENVDVESFLKQEINEINEINEVAEDEEAFKSGTDDPPVHFPEVSSSVGGTEERKDKSNFRGTGKLKRKKKERQRWPVTEIEPGIFEYRKLTFSQLESGEFRCHLCSAVNKRRNSMRNHLKYSHLRHEKIKKGPFQCSLCENCYDWRSSLTAHISAVHHGKFHECRLCSRKFIHRSTYTLHMQRHEAPVKFVCKVENCEKSFPNMRLLRQHEDGTQHFLALRKKPEKESWDCDMCGKKYTTKHSLRSHTDVVHSGKRHICHVCGKEFMYRTVLRRHLFLHNPRTFICEIENCKRAYCSAKSLEYHIKYSHLAERVLCSMCGKSFVNKRALRIHEYVHNPGTPRERQQCNTCGKMYVNLREHMRKVHGDLPRTFLCPIENCKRAFVSSYALKLHNRMHTGDERGPFFCSTCGKSFKWKEGHRLHELTHSGSSLKCNVCDKPCSTPSNLRQHMLVHDSEAPLRFQCTVDNCNKSFLRRAELRKHELLHAGVAEHQCPECPSRFVLKSQLTYHSYSHRDSLPFPCHLCSSQFLTRYKLTRHLKNVHKLGPIEVNERLIECEMKFKNLNK